MSCIVRTTSGRFLLLDSPDHVDAAVVASNYLEAEAQMNNHGEPLENVGAWTQNTQNDLGDNQKSLYCESLKIEDDIEYDDGELGSGHLLRPEPSRPKLSWRDMICWYAVSSILSMKHAVYRPKTTRTTRHRCPRPICSTLMIISFALCLIMYGLAAYFIARTRVALTPAISEDTCSGSVLPAEWLFDKLSKRFSPGELPYLSMLAAMLYMTLVLSFMACDTNRARSRPRYSMRYQQIVENASLYPVYSVRVVAVDRFSYYASKKRWVGMVHLISAISNKSPGAWILGGIFTALMLGLYTKCHFQSAVFDFMPWTLLASMLLARTTVSPPRFEIVLEAMRYEEEAEISGPKKERKKVQLVPVESLHAHEVSTVDLEDLEVIVARMHAERRIREGDRLRLDGIWKDICSEVEKRAMESGCQDDLPMHRARDSQPKTIVSRVMW